MDQNNIYIKVSELRVIIDGLVMIGETRSLGAIARILGVINKTAKQKEKFRLRHCLHLGKGHVHDQCADSCGN